MASANPFVLLVNSSFGWSQIIGWIDQAILLTCVDPALYNTLRAYGVRSATTFIAATTCGSADYPNSDVIAKTLAEYSPELVREQTEVQLVTIGHVIRGNLQFRRLSNLSQTSVETWTMELIAEQFSDNRDGAQFGNSIIQRFNNYSPLIIPASAITVVGCLAVLWTNFRIAAEQLTTLIAIPALAQTGGTHIIGLPSSVRSVIACFLAFGILITLGVCLYSGFLSNKPSQRAADSVRTILGFSFDVVTGALSGGA